MIPIVESRKAKRALRIVGLGRFAVGPLRGKFERTVAERAPKYVAQGIAQARENIEPHTEKIEAVVNVLENVANPREAVEAEIHQLTEMTNDAIFQQRIRRVDAPLPNRLQPEPERPTGILGFFTRAVNNVRSFFDGSFFAKAADKVRGWFGRPVQPKPTPEPIRDITAYDAGAGIRATIESILDDEQVRRQFPILSELLAIQFPDPDDLKGRLKDMKHKLPSADKFAFVASDILSLFASVKPRNEAEGNRTKHLIESVSRYPHELRFLTHLPTFLHHNLARLDRLQVALPRLLPDLLATLPEKGSQIRDIYNQLQTVLQYNPPAVSTEEVPVKPRLRDRIRKLFGRRLR